MPVDDKPIRRGSRAKPGAGEDEEDMMTKDLAEDAVWKKIQQNTFARWANEHLRTVNKAVTDLSTDFSDGLKLIALVEVLSGKKLPPYNKRPKMRAQKLENVNIAIQFLKNQEKIRIVNIDSIDVVDGKVKLIMGVMWTLILHYSISMPMWEGEDESLYKEKGGPTPKQRLLKWIQSKVPEVPINNFTTDWNDGKAIGALVDACAPGLCPDWDKWQPKDALKNATEAMKIAEQFLDVPQLVKPEELVNPKVDELSMMTYLSQFPKAKLKDGAPTRPRHNPKRVRCYGPGIQPTGVNMGAKTSFTVDTFSAGQGDVQVFLQDPSGKQTPVDVKFNDDKGKTYTCSYTAKAEGPHKVIVKFSGVEVPKSPFNVEVKGVAGDASKVKCDGAGLKPGNKVGSPTSFDIDASEAGVGQIDVNIIDPKGKANSVPMRVTQDETKDGKYKCEYQPQLEGPHKVEVNFAGKPVPNSPFTVKVAARCNPEKVRALGRGIQPSGVRVNDIADFKVFTEGAGAGMPEVKVQGPDGQPVKCSVRKLADGVTYDCDYKPLKEGRYVVTVSFAGQEIFQSPYEVQVGPVKDCKIVAYGPGLKGGVVDHPALFTVDTNGEQGTLGFSVEGPSYAKIECKDNGDGSAQVQYHPTAPGEYAIHVTVDGEDIPNSPFMPMIIPKTDYDPSKVVVTGPGVAPKGVVIAQPTDFVVDTKKAGKAPLDISVMTNADYKELDVKVTNNKDGTFKAQYKPDKLGKHTVHVNYGGVAIPKSPYRVSVGGVPDASKVIVSGPGVSKGVKPQQPTFYVIDTKQAGGGELVTSVKDEKGKDVPVNIIDHQDGMYTAEYTAPAPGKYKVTTTYAGRPVPGSPVELAVTPPADVSKVKVEGLEPNQFVSCINAFNVDARAVDKNGDGNVEPLIINVATGKKVPPSVVNNNDGTYKVSYVLPEEGEYKFDVKYDNAPIPGASPVKVKATHGADPKRVKAYGPGLEKGFLNQPNQFTIETINAGNGGIGLNVEGPSEAKVKCQDNRDGTCTVEYIPDEGGIYDIHIKFADENIPGSVFKVPVQSEVDASKVTAAGPGVDPENCRAAASLPFKVNAKRSAKAPLEVQVSGDKGPIAQKPEIKDNNDGTYDVSYVPPPEGSKCDVKVTYGGKDIAGSPFKLKVKKKSEPKNVKLSGPGLEKEVLASVPQEFTVDTKKAGIGDLDIDIKGPNNKGLRYWKTDFHDGTFKIRYIPEDCGEHKITVRYDGAEVPGSPATVNAKATGDVNKCQIKGKFPEKLKPGEECLINVAADKAGGNGEITCRVTRTQSKSEVSEESTERFEQLPDGGTRIIKTTRRETKTATSKEIAENIDCKVSKNPDGTYAIKYRVQEPGEYLIEVKYGGQVVPNGTFKFTVS